MSPNDGVIVLMYHRVGLARNAWEARYAISPGRFEAHMLALARNGLHAVSVESLSDWLDGGAPLATGAFVLTFDDGFRDVRLHALPVLERLRWPFTVFLVSSLVGKEDFWTRASNPDGATYPLLNAEEILDMQQRGVSCQSHSSSHPSLPSLDDHQLASELGESRAALRHMLGRSITLHIPSVIWTSASSPRRVALAIALRSRPSRVSTAVTSIASESAASTCTAPTHRAC
jgi:peptidoglycan/xylan/chitin deacetylase (PgdA/CDA1 family)